MSPWTHLVRFIAKEDGESYYATSNSQMLKVGEKVKGFKSITALEKDDGASTASFEIKQLVSPVAPGLPIVCIGMNYANHAKEAGLEIPKNPPMWYKPSESLAEPGIIPIPKVAQTNFLDFEGEFTIVTSKAAKNVSVEDAPNYILGYTIGNDLTARQFQIGQFTYAKSFDNFAPIGPAIVNAKAFGAIEGKQLKTTINGGVVQNSPVDLIWGPTELVSFLSQGRTLPAGTAIMTGTPAGVGWFQKPQYSLKDGDVVDISIDGLGTLSNTMKFE
ncbi:2-hydroxyhepta-2,4-diene-1,7-dioate isomerase [Rhexocercosporidium sp. MPI-PUGE-AT-0058]|nr:2-hydroxyhepta-2,4-diene-1,7-dioate isomerase [Rhexocercosporidium sp. MPI-PUGE-AT-0058]